MSRVFEVESKKGKELPQGIKKITVNYPENVTGETWVNFFDVYYEQLGDLDKGRRSPGAQMKAKFLGGLPLLDSVTYIDALGVVHDVKQEGLKAPLVVCQYVATIVDTELYKDLQIPNP